MSDSEKNDDHGKWTYHEYEIDGEKGYVISGGLLPDSASVNQKAHELGHDINQQDWVRTDKTEGTAARYFYSSGHVGDELVNDESKAIGPFYDLCGDYPIYTLVTLAAALAGVPITVVLIIMGITVSPRYTNIAVIVAMIGFAVSLVGAVFMVSGPGRRIVDSTGAAVTSAKGTPVRIRISSAIRRVLRRCHVKVDAAPEGWNRMVRNGKVVNGGVAADLLGEDRVPTKRVVYIHEHAGTATFVTRDDAIAMVSRQVREFNLPATPSVRLVTESNLDETSASTVIGALQNIIGPSTIPSAVSTLDAEQSRAVMARLRTRTPEK